MSRRIDTSRDLWGSDERRGGRRDDNRMDRGQRSGGDRNDRQEQSTRETRGREHSLSDYNQESEYESRRGGGGRIIVDNDRSSSLLTDFDFQTEMRNSRLVGLFMVETGTYQDQVLRPMTTDTNYQAIDDLVESILEDDGNLTLPTAASKARNLIAPSRDYERDIHIDEGSWNDRRWAFMLVVDHGETNTSGVKREIITGFTNSIDSLDPTKNGLFEERECVFTPNSVMVMRIRRRTGIRGAQTDLKVLNSCNILTSDNLGSDIDGARKMTPKVVFSTLSKRETFGEDFDTEGQFHDMSSYVTQQGTTASRNYANPSSYLESTINSYLDSEREAIHANRPNSQDSFRSSGRLVDTPDYDSTDFYKMIHRRANSMNTTFTLQDLVLLFDNFNPFEDSRVQINYMGKGTKAREQTDYVNSTRDVKKSDENTFAANIVATSVVGLMMSAGFTKLDFIVESTGSSFGMRTNPTDLYSMHQAGDFECFSPEAEVQIEMWNIFRYSFIERVLKLITNDNNMSIYLEVKASVYNTVYITISVDGDELDNFAFPLFSDSLTSPLLTFDSDRFGSTVSGLGTVMSTVTERIVNQNPLHSPRRRNV